MDRPMPMSRYDRLSPSAKAQKAKSMQKIRDTSARSLFRTDLPSWGE